MAYTSHGHHMPGTVDNHERPTHIARCGGPGLCGVCSKETAMYNHPSNTTIPHNSKDASMLNIARYSRKTYEVEGVQITEENMEEVAAWCEGEVRKTKGLGKLHVYVPVHRPQNDRQTRGYVGDWVLKSGPGFKVYAEKAFPKCFEPSAEKADATPTYLEN